MRKKQVKVKTFWRWTMIIVSIVVLVIGGVTITRLAAGPSMARTTVGGNDYPWSNYEGLGSVPLASVWTDPNGKQNSPLGFGYRNCTDYAAYEINEQLGGNATDTIKFSFSKIEYNNDGNAEAWKNGAISHYGASAVNTVPAVGSVAWWGPEVAGGLGYVAIVAWVSKDGKSIIVDSYNHLLDGNYDSYTITKASGWPDDFLHIADIAAASTTALRLGVLTSSGDFLVKENGLTAQWTTVCSGVIQGIVAGDLIGVVTKSGTFLVKEGNLDAPWTTEYSGVKAAMLSAGTVGPLRIGVLTTDGTFLVKEGSVDAQWTTEYNDVSQGMLSGNYIGVVTDSGTFRVKQGDLSAQWTTEYTGAKAGALSAGTGTTSLLIGVLTNNGTFLVKQGRLSAQWVSEYAGAVAGYVSRNRIGVLTSNGTLLIKQGSLIAPWVTEYSGVTQVHLSSDLIGVLSSGNYLIKEGNLNAQWVSEYSGGTAGSLWDVGA